MGSREGSGHLDDGRKGKTVTRAGMVATMRDRGIGAFGHLVWSRGKNLDGRGGAHHGDAVERES